MAPSPASTVFTANVTHILRHEYSATIIELITGKIMILEFPLWDTKSLVYVTHKVPSGVFVLPALSQTIASLVSRG